MLCFIFHNVNINLFVKTTSSSKHFVIFAKVTQRENEVDGTWGGGWRNLEIVLVGNPHGDEPLCKDGIKMALGELGVDSSGLG